MGYTAMALVCALSVVTAEDGELDPQRCTVDTARDVIQAPSTTGGATGCLFQAMAYFADALGDYVTPEDYVRVLCTKENT